MMTRFRPCIDLHQGVVKQIVGGTLNDEGARENFVSTRCAGDYATLFRRDELRGGHVIQLGPGNEEAAREALAAWPEGLQLGGGIHQGNAMKWLEAGASAVIVTSALFSDEGQFEKKRLEALSEEVGPQRLVVDLSCRRVGEGWQVATNRWQTITETMVEEALLDELAPFCAEFLIHAADVEGLCQGFDPELVALLGGWSGERPITYAGGVRGLEDLAAIEELSDGRLDVTVGSALDLFGGDGVTYQDLLQWNRTRA